MWRCLGAHPQMEILLLDNDGKMKFKRLNFTCSMNTPFCSFLVNRKGKTAVPFVQGKGKFHNIDSNNENFPKPIIIISCMLY